MTSFSFGGTGGGAGFEYRTPPDVFSGADRSAAETARNDFFTANPADLAEFNADTNLNIRLEYDDGGEAVATNQVRNGAGAQWNDNASFVGVRGQDGTATIPIAPAGTILMVDANGDLAASSMREVTDIIESGKSIGLPDNSINFLNLRVSASQGRFIAYDMLNEVYAMIGSRPLTAAGTGGYTVELATARQGPVLFQPRFADNTHTTTDLGFNFTNITKAIIDNWITRGTDGKFYIQIHDGNDATGRVIYRSHTPAQIASLDVFDLTGNDGTADFILDTSLEPAFQDTDQTIFVRLLSPDENTFTVLGTVTTPDDVNANPLGFTVVGQNVPYFGTRFWAIIDEPVVTETLLTGGENQGVTVTRNEVTGVYNFSVTGVAPPVTPDPAVMGFTIDIDAPVPLNTDLNVATEIRFTTQETASITALTLTGIGDDVSLTLPSSDGSHTQSVTLANVDTTSATTYRPQIRGTTSGGQTIMSNVVAVNVRTTQPHELAYYGIRPTDDFASVSLASLTSVDVQPPGSQFTIAESFPATEVLGILEPADRPITSVIESAFNQEIFAGANQRFTVTMSARTISGQLYNLYTLTNNGPTGQIILEVTHA